MSIDFPISTLPVCNVIDKSDKSFIKDSKYVPDFTWHSENAHL